MDEKDNETKESSPRSGDEVNASAAGKKTKGTKKGDLTLIDLGFSALLLVLLAFLTVNVFVIYTASSYNASICQSSMDFVKVAALEGRDTDAVVRAAYGCMDRCAKGGFFVERPNLVFFNDEITKDLRTVTVTTTTKALIPVPFLVFDKSRFDDDGMHMTFKSTCCFKLSNPKNCQGTHRLRIPGNALEVKKDSPAQNKSESKSETK